ncbi:MAG: hypothetical protein Satyrvirus28_16 [Satyrvirus sp.]|uniref:Uncharacterized protein n=1 Tax=Satyrvirus sp. TaxID=2487771 RepID=A0A3G5AEU8_9VIRU|nr:MAG: hypothetical protein Satyrvirus28_16 [Satyrvirus sp.]
MPKTTPAPNSLLPMVPLEYPYENIYDECSCGHHGFFNFHVQRIDINDYLKIINRETICVCGCKITRTTIINELSQNLERGESFDNSLFGKFCKYFLLGVPFYFFYRFVRCSFIF